MKIITGERIQELAHVSFSRNDDKGLESQNVTTYDVENFEFDGYDNPEVVYCNSGLINKFKPILINVKLYEKLKKFKNPFDLILHNSDQSFDKVHEEYFNIPNIKRIFTQNMNTTHPKLFPLPIGLANSRWKWGDLNIFEKHLNSLPEEKTNSIFFNFKIDGGVREEYRPQCYEACINKGLKWTEDTDFDSYINNLKTYKYCISPEGNGIDCYRMWECLYLRVIPVCHRNIVTEYFSKLFPIVLVDNWNDLNLDYLERNYETLSNWKNYYLLDCDLYYKYITNNG